MHQKSYWLGVPVRKKLNKRCGLKWIKIKHKWAVVVGQVVAHRTMDPEVLGSIPAGSWAVSLVSFLTLSHVSISGASLIRSLVEVQHYHTEKWRHSSAA